MRVMRVLCPGCGKAPIENASGMCNECRRVKKAVKKWRRKRES